MKKLLNLPGYFAALVCLFSFQTGCIPQPDKDDDREVVHTPSITIPSVEVSHTRLSTSYGHTLRIAEDGKLFASGLNSHGQLGDGSTQNSRQFLQVGSDTDWIEASAGAHHSVGLREDGTVWTWGGNSLGQLGNNTMYDKHVPKKIGTNFLCSTIASGYDHVLAIRTDGTLWTWGLNLTDATTRNHPVLVNRETDWATVSAGPYHSLALKKDGSLWAWGQNSAGHLGTGTTADEPNPVEISLGTTWAQVRAGKWCSIGIRSDGSIWVWGMWWGDSSPTPIQVGTDNDWRDCAAGYFSFSAIREDGSLWSWGDNWMYKLGVNTGNLFVPFPTQVSPGQTWLIVARGEDTMTVIREDGSLHGWGANSYGQMGY